MSELHTVSPLYSRCYNCAPQHQTLPDVLNDQVIESCIIKDQTIRSGDFTNACFRRVIFQNCRLLDCTFSGCKLLESRFIGCDLTGSDFAGSVWKDTISWLTKGFYIKDARLTNAIFEDCSFSIEDLTNCIVESVEIYKGSL